LSSKAFELLNYSPIKQSRRKKLVLLLGSGISKSLSPEINNKAFRELGLDIEYGLCDVTVDEFDSTVTQILKDDRIIGLNVTIPFKEQIIRYTTELDAIAKTVQAVNLVAISSNRKKIAGYNTDIDGVIASLSKLGLLGRSGLRAVILGAGGAARGCLYAILTNGFDSAVILNRNKKRAEELVPDFAKRFPEKKIETAGLNASEFELELKSADLVVNTIPFGAELRFDLSFRSAPPRLKLLDLNYRRNPPVLRLARREGISCIDGSLMLVEQAARSFEILTGISAPRKTMLLAVKKRS